MKGELCALTSAVEAVCQLLVVKDPFTFSNRQKSQISCVCPAEEQKLPSMSGLPGSLLKEQCVCGCVSGILVSLFSKATTVCIYLKFPTLREIAVLSYLKAYISKHYIL